jgi:hypothetical protein
MKINRTILQHICYLCLYPGLAWIRQFLHRMGIWLVHMRLLKTLLVLREGSISAQLDKQSCDN